MKIQVIDHKIIRVYFPESEKEKNSFAVEKTEPINYSIEEANEESIILTNSLKIKINKKKNTLKIYDHDNNPILSDYEDLGYKKIDNKIFCYKEIRDEIAFLGFGERTGSLNKKGKRLINWNTDEPHHSPKADPLYQSHPFFIAYSPTRSYGLFFDHTNLSYFDMGNENEKYWYFASEGEELDYYFIYGPTPKEVIEGYTKLTGRYYMPPIWALGFQQSRWSYESEEKVINIAKTFRKKNIPCDVIYLDIDYMDGYRVFTVNKKKFPNFEKMVKDLKEEGFKIVLIVDPGIKKDESYEVYKEGIEKGYFCKRNKDVYIGYVWPGKCAFPDFIRKDVRSWWGEKLKKLINLGISGIWNDMNEPSSLSKIEYYLMRLLFYFLKLKEPPSLPKPSEFNAKIKEIKRKTLPSDVLHGENQEFTHADIHNAYGLLMTKASFEGWKKYSDKRPLIVSRAGFSGIQKYSAVWTGDNKSSWEHLYMSIPMLQNLSLSGVPFVGADVGGFWRDCTPELFIRWIQLGVFYPFFRVHSAMNTKPQEPWSFGENVEKIAKKYIILRYKLIPYIYSLFYEAKEKGIPPLRSLLLEFPEDINAIKHEDEFMLGPNLLIAPIYKEGEKERDVYFPSGFWYDFYSYKEYRGPGVYKVYADLDTIPIFVREGSIIPMWEEQNYVGEKKQNFLELKIFPGSGEFLYYEDDGETWNYEKGEFNLIKFSCFLEEGEKYLKIEYLHKGYLGGREKFIVYDIKGNKWEFNEGGEIYACIGT